MMCRTFSSCRGAGDLRRVRGFSMVEIAIVFGIMAIVISGVWVAYAGVREKQFVDSAVGEMVEIVTNAKSLYAGRYNHTLPATGVLQCTEGVFPRDLCDRDRVNPWGGEYVVTFNGAAQPRTMTLRSASADDQLLPNRACTELLMILNSSLPLRSLEVRSGGNWISVRPEPADIGLQMDAGGCQGVGITSNL